MLRRAVQDSPAWNRHVAVFDRRLCGGFYFSRLFRLFRCDYRVRVFALVEFFLEAVVNIAFLDAEVEQFVDALDFVLGQAFDVQVVEVPVGFAHFRSI